MGRLWRVWKSELEAFLREDEGFHGDES